MGDMAPIIVFHGKNPVVDDYCACTNNSCHIDFRAARRLR